MSIGNPTGRTPATVDEQELPARRIARGVRRMLAAAGQSTIEEMRLPDGRRADIVGVSPDGSIQIVEVKSGLADYRADRKWRNYMEFCDRLYFAAAIDTPAHIFPEDIGLIVADDFGARIVRTGVEQRLAAARRKAMLLSFARTAADRLHGLHDPHWRNASD